MIGEIVGMAVAARTHEGNMDDLVLPDLSNGIKIIWRRNRSLGRQTDLKYADGRAPHPLTDSPA